MKLLEILIAIAFFTVVVLLVYSEFYNVYVVAFDYKSTEGKIVKAEVEQIQQEVDCGEHCTETIIAFRPKLLYEYQIGNVKYFGTRYRFFSRGEDKLWAEHIIKTLAVEKQITVFYNPQYPERSVLTKEVPKDYWEHLVFIIIFIIGVSTAFYRQYYLSNNKRNDTQIYVGFEKV
jgi:hypothetical protein